MALTEETGYLRASSSQLENHLIILSRYKVGCERGFGAVYEGKRLDDSLEES